ncbi:MAG: hypothetical protein OXE53_13105 [Deltaproteobacteria bacterium]|nr:hypothetical protein [Deltaproteobacteria bacterium]
MKATLRSPASLNGIPMLNTLSAYGLTRALDALFGDGDALDTLAIRAGNTELAATLDDGFPKLGNTGVLYQASFILPGDNTNQVAAASLNVHDGSDVVWTTQAESFVVSTSPNPVPSPITLLGGQPYVFLWELVGNIDTRFTGDDSMLGSGIEALSITNSGQNLVQNIAGLRSDSYGSPEVQLWGPDPMSGLPPGPGDEEGPGAYDPDRVILRERITDVTPTVAANEVSFAFRMPALTDGGLLGNRYGVLLVGTTRVLGVEDLGPVGPRTEDTQDSTAILTLTSPSG